VMGSKRYGIGMKKGCNKKWLLGQTFKGQIIIFTLPV
jgi:hypothetical protein